MNRKKERQLIKKYPKLFAQSFLPPSKSAMCFGLECSETWFPIIDKLCSKIQRYLDDRYSKLLDDAQQIEFTQIKEKFGSLRVYYGPWNAQIDAFIAEAERESVKTCYKCGNKKKVTMTKGGWIIPLCSECHKENK